MDRRQEIGRLGEEIAVKYLLGNNYNIVEKNYRCTYGEIDIIAFDENIKEKQLIFIEVKTRSNVSFGKGIEAINIKKQKHIYKSAEYYLQKNNKENNNIRIDGIEVLINKNNVLLKHYYNIIIENPYNRRKY